MRITVVGDVLLDVDLVGTAERLSPDAPVPVVDVRSAERRAGGAGLVASMLARDGHDVTLVTALSDDASAGELRQALDGVTMVSCRSGAPTPVKTRLRAAGQSVARIDEGCDRPGVPEVSAEMLDAVDTADAVIVADYGRALTENAALRQALTGFGQRAPLVWDPHPNGAVPVHSTWAATPNTPEAEKATHLAIPDARAAAQAAAQLRARWGCSAVVVTLGSRGALLEKAERGQSGGGLPFVVPAPSIRVSDPCGAGDRLAASLVVGLAHGLPIEEALEDAVADAASFLAAGGVAALSAPDNTSRLAVDTSDALAVVHSTREAGGTVVATGGCFDLLHAGHARALSAARGLGDCLIVCLNSDDSVRRLKGASRPIMNEHDRVDLLLALECVDAVVVFDEDTPEAVIRRLEPDLWVKGGDYVADDLPEAAILAEWGGTAVTVPYYPGRSSTALAAALAKVS
ncbi:D-glycero-beta-D-manno-heptose 1-phosphate adenylyltransferase [Okibacterium endophyticum]